MNHSLTICDVRTTRIIVVLAHQSKSSLSKDFRLGTLTMSRTPCVRPKGHKYS
jgi:hypothetical protein